MGLVYRDLLHTINDMNSDYNYTKHFFGYKPIPIDKKIDLFDAMKNWGVELSEETDTKRSRTPIYDIIKKDLKIYYEYYEFIQKYKWINFMYTLCENELLRGEYKEKIKQKLQINEINDNFFRENDKYDDIFNFAKEVELDRENNVTVNIKSNELINYCISDFENLETTEGWGTITEKFLEGSILMTPILKYTYKESSSLLWANKKTKITEHIKEIEARTHKLFTD